MGNFGFSYVGLVFLLMLFIPNTIWTKHKPQGYTSEGENKVLQLFEKIGQAGVTCTALVFSNFNLQKWSWWSLWLVAAFAAMLLYEGWWLRYFKSSKTLQDFYSGFLGVPLAGATLPVFAFLLLSIYGRVIWLTIFVVLLGIGHIGIHMQHARQIKNTQQDEGHQ